MSCQASLRHHTLPSIFKNKAMKVTDLMIGDWANLSEDDIYRIPCKVVELHTDELLVIQPQDTACDVVGYDMIRPIPLTLEILEKNENVKELGYWDKENNVFRLYAVPIVNLWDVHILQHALRLCGLNDLADNFKI